MNDQFPNFELEHIPVVADQPPKKRNKPMRRKAHAVTDAPKRRKMLRTVKAKIVRRGRPKGSINKPKAPQVVVGGRFTKDQYRIIALCLGLTSADRNAVLEVIKGISQ